MAMETESQVTNQDYELKTVFCFRNKQRGSERVRGVGKEDGGELDSADPGATAAS